MMVRKNRGASLSLLMLIMLAAIPALIIKEAFRQDEYNLGLIILGALATVPLIVTVIKTIYSIKRKCKNDK